MKKAVCILSLTAAVLLITTIVFGVGYGREKEKEKALRTAWISDCAAMTENAAGGHPEALRDAAASLFAFSREYFYGNYDDGDYISVSSFWQFMMRHPDFCAEHTEELSDIFSLLSENFSHANAYAKMERLIHAYEDSLS